MTYQIIDNFAAGLDTRKSPLTSPPGTLTRLINAVVTPGGEIAKRRAFVQCANLYQSPISNSFGLAATASKLWVFGRNAKPYTPPLDPMPGGIPGVTLEGLQVPNATADLVQTDFDVFNGLVYLACSQPSVTAKPNPHYYALSAIAPDMAETEGTGKGYYVRAFQSKMYSVIGQYLHFSALGNPNKWVPESSVPANVGAGNINVASNDADSEVLSSLEVYYKQLAVFSTKSVQIWTINTNQNLNQFEQLLRGSGTTAARSPLMYGSGDVLYLDPSGIRSLRAKDSSNSASVSDIGSPVDDVVQKLRLAKTDNYMAKAIALLEPSVGRFWMVFPDQILVLSYFPAPKITAWSTFTLPELGSATVQHAVSCGGRIFLRDTTDKLWVYGGADALTYNNCGVEVRLPYLDGKKPGHKKMFRAIDATISGTWSIRVSFDYNNPDFEEQVATISVPTWNAGAGELQGYDSHFSLRFYNNDALAATISNCAIHYDMADDEA